VRSDEAKNAALTRVGLCNRAALVCLLVATALLAWSLCRPRVTAAGAMPAARSLAPVPDERVDVQAVLAKVAGRTLVRPAQVQAAVKSDGTAEQLLKLLKLQGVIDVGGKPTAYIAVEKQGVKTVRPGDKILDFTVDKIEPGKVVLSLQGVVVTLGNG
jgi:hypothetical protein